MKIAVIVGHPAKESLCHGLASAYVDGARATGAEVQVISIGELKFDPILHEGYRRIQDLEPDLKKVQDLIVWAEHLVFVYPVWWGSIPALFKGLLDRAILPGFGFKYHAKGAMWDKYLKGRSARLITTSDAPSFWLRFAFRNSDVNMMKHAVLKFCGISPVKVTRFAQVRFSTPEKRERWIAEARRLGSRLA